MLVGDSGVKSMAQMPITQQACFKQPLSEFGSNQLLNQVSNCTLHQIITSSFLNLICVFFPGVMDSQAPRISSNIWTYHCMGAAIEVAQLQCEYKVIEKLGPYLIEFFPLNKRLNLWLNPEERSHDWIYDNHVQITRNNLAQNRRMT